MGKDPHDPRGLIREAYCIENITEDQCRSIFLDWALGHRDTGDLSPHLEALYARYGARRSHPMSAILRAGLASPPRPKRRGGWRARRN